MERKVLVGRELREMDESDEDAGRKKERQPTLLHPRGLSGLLMFTSRISIKMGGGVSVCIRV